MEVLIVILVLLWIGLPLAFYLILVPRRNARKELIDYIRKHRKITVGDGKIIYDKDFKW